MALHLLSAWFASGNNHPDGHFQILEFANYKLGNTPPTDLAWEFSTQIRPAIQPAIAYTVHQALGLIGISNPFHITFVLRLISAIIGLAASLALCFYSFRWFTNHRLKQLLFLITCFLWVLPFLHARFTSESWSASFLSLGIWLLLVACDQIQIKRAALYAALSGLALGFAFYFRFPVGFALLGIALWLTLIRRPIPLIIIGTGFIGFCLAVMINFAIDRWLYGNWAFTPYNYFILNIIHQSAAAFGVSPWWYYIQKLLIILVPPYSLLLLGMLVVTCVRYPKNLLVWVFVPFLLGHSLIGHKETRFLIPIIPLLPILILLGFDGLSAKLPRPINAFFASVAVRLGWYLLLLINVILLIPLTFLPAHKYAVLQEWMYVRGETGPYELWTYGVNPYRHDELNMHYYESPNLTLKQVASNEQLCQHLANSSAPVYVYITEPEKAQQLQNSCAQLHLQATRYPTWLRRLDIYDWLSASRIPGVFRLSNK